MRHVIERATDHHHWWVVIRHSIERATDHPVFWAQWWATWGLGGSVWAGITLDTVVQLGTIVLITLNCGVAFIKIIDWWEERRARKLQTPED